MPSHVLKTSSPGTVAVPPGGLWVPTTWIDLHAVPSERVVYKGNASIVVESSPGILVKASYDLSEEVICARYAREKVSLPVPRILYHPRLAYQPSQLSRPMTTGAWYFCVERAPGVSLEKVVDAMSEEQLQHVAAQLKSILRQMHTVKPKTLGSVTGGPFRNCFFPGHVSPKHAFTSVGELTDYFRRMLLYFSAEDWTEQLLSHFPRNAPIRFTHGDLIPRNIIVDGSTITAVVDWATGGFYPEYWEYCRMYNSDWLTPGWTRILQIIYPGPRRDAEVDAVSYLVACIWFNM